MNQLNVVIPILMMMLTILASNILFFVTNNSPIYYSFYALFYILGYFYVLIFSKIQLKFTHIVILVLALRLYLFAIAYNDDAYAITLFGLHETGDSVRYHISFVIKHIHDFNDLVFYTLFSNDDYSGRLLRSVIYFYTELLNLLDINDNNIINIGRINYLVNTILIIFILNLIYKTSYIYSLSNAFSQRAVFFIAFNPFFLNYTSAPLKEIFVFLSLSLFLKFIVELKYKDKKNYKLFYLSLFILLFERLYMVPLLIFIYIFVNKNNINKIFLFVFMIIILILTEVFIGIDRGVNIYFNFRNNITSIGESYLGNNHGVISNIARTILGPMFLRPFLNEYMPNNIFYALSYLSYLLMYLISVKAFLNIKEFSSKLIILTLFYIFIFWPFHSTLKITILIIFSTIFLDSVSFVKLSNRRRGWGENNNSR